MKTIIWLCGFLAASGEAESPGRPGMTTRLNSCVVALRCRYWEAKTKSGNCTSSYMVNHNWNKKFDTGHLIELMCSMPLHSMCAESL